MLLPYGCPAPTDADQAKKSACAIALTPSTAAQPNKNPVLTSHPHPDAVKLTARHHKPVAPPAFMQNSGEIPGLAASQDGEPQRSAQLADLIAGIRHRSSSAFERLYRSESRRLYGIALRITRRPDIAAEALQDAFIQIWQNAATFSDERGSPAAWLTGIVRYRALDAVRKLGRELSSDDFGSVDTLADERSMEALERGVDTAALRHCMDLLDNHQRECITLAFVGGRSHSEIATQLSTPLGTIKSYIRRGLQTLRRCLET